MMRMITMDSSHSAAAVSVNNDHDDDHDDHDNDDDRTPSSPRRPTDPRPDPTLLSATQGAAAPYLITSILVNFHHQYII